MPPVLSKYKVSLASVLSVLVVVIGGTYKVGAHAESIKTEIKSTTIAVEKNKEKTQSNKEDISSMKEKVSQLQKQEQTKAQELKIVQQRLARLEGENAEALKFIRASLQRLEKDK